MVAERCAQRRVCSALAYSRRRTRGLTGHDPCMQIIGAPVPRLGKVGAFANHRRVVRSVLRCPTFDLHEGGCWTLIPKDLWTDSMFE